MFGGHFYNQRIRKAVAVFGSLFNNLSVVRQNSSGAVISQVKVPLSYAPKRDFLARLDAMQNGEEAERQVAVKLPRMSFEIVAMSYDTTRQLAKINSCTTHSSTDTTKATRIYTPVPYNISFQLSIYAKSQDDALQIVEQVLPYFTPNYTLTITPLSDFNTVKEDNSIILQGITFSDDYDAPLESRRTIIYTLDFEMKINLYKDINAASSIITSYEVDVKDLDGNDLFTITSDAPNSANTTSISIDEDESYTASTFKISNVRDTVTSFEISTAASHGTATTSFTEMSTSLYDGSLFAAGTWTYVPNPDYNGSDTFTIKANFVDGSYLLVPITVTIAGGVDIANDDGASIDSSIDSYIDIDVGANDDFEASTLVFSVASDPSNGTAVVTDAANGIIRYTPTPDWEGTDTFTYTVTPEGGTAETATVTVAVTASILMAVESGESILIEDGSILAVEE